MPPAPCCRGPGRSRSSRPSSCTSARPFDGSGHSPSRKPLSSDCCTLLGGTNTVVSTPPVPDLAHRDLVLRLRRRCPDQAQEQRSQHPESRGERSPGSPLASPLFECSSRPARIRAEPRRRSGNRLSRFRAFLRSRGWKTVKPSIRRADKQEPCRREFAESPDFDAPRDIWWGGERIEPNDAMWWSGRASRTRPTGAGPVGSPGLSAVHLCSPSGPANSSMSASSHRQIRACRSPKNGREKRPEPLKTGPGCARCVETPEPAPAPGPQVAAHSAILVPGGVSGSITWHTRTLRDTPPSGRITPARDPAARGSGRGSTSRRPGSRLPWICCRALHPAQ